MAVNEKNFADGEVLGAPTGIRTLVLALKGLRPNH